MNFPMKCSITWSSDGLPFNMRPSFKMDIFSVSGTIKGENKAQQNLVATKLGGIHYD